MAGKLNLDPQGIVDKEFDIDFKGYNPDQVDHMLGSLTPLCKDIFHISA